MNLELHIKHPSAGIYALYLADTDSGKRVPITLSTSAANLYFLAEEISNLTQGEIGYDSEVLDDYDRICVERDEAQELVAKLRRKLNSILPWEA